jgi:hypothetical protein
MTKIHSQVVLAALTLGLVACEGSITSVSDPDPGLDAAASAGLGLGYENCVVPGADLISWWAGDGDLTDLVGNNPIGSASGVSFVDGVHEQAFRFPGSAAQIEIDDSGTLKPTVFTVDLWAERLGGGMNSDNTYGNMLIQKAIDADGAGLSWSYFISWRADGRIAAGVYFDEDLAVGSAYYAPVRLVSKDAFPNDNPIFIALSVDGPDVTLYVFDGEHDAVQGAFNVGDFGFDAGTSVAYGPGATVIGSNWKPARDVGYPRTFDGIIDEVEIFGSSLTQAELQAIYSAGKCKGVEGETVVYSLTIDQATVRLDSQGRDDKDAFDVDGKLPLDLLEGFQPTTDEVIVRFADFEQTIGLGSFVRKDDKWEFKVSPNTAGIWRIDLHDDGRFKLQANGPFDPDWREEGYFSGPIELFLEVGLHMGEASVRLDRNLHFRAH